MLGDPLLHFMAANIYILAIIAMSCCNNRKALFQYRPTVLDMYAQIKSCAHTRNV